MNPFTFSLMLLLQRADEALEHHRSLGGERSTNMSRLAERRQRLASRLRRSLGRPALSGS